MDRTWMTKPRTSLEYQRGVDEFLEQAAQNAGMGNRIYCPCVRCGNKSLQFVKDVKGHLYFNGINSNYQKWIWHGEGASSSASVNFNFANVDVGVDENENENENDDDDVVGMVNDIEEDFVDHHEKFERLLGDAEKPLYFGCTNNFTKLSAIVRLYNLKAGNGWSDKSFSELLKLLAEMLPQPNELPTSMYEVKKAMSSLGMGYEKIHACRNDCILYRNECKDLESCPVCGESRWKLEKNEGTKKKGVPAKVLWYIPPIPRFRRLFRNAEHAKNLTWHADRRINDGMLRHPADAPQWKTIDRLYPEFSRDARNLRLGLSTDGINPHGLQSSSHSTWPVLLVNYNLPPHLCMKRKFVMLTMLISGPRQPGNDIDVYLAPLIEDLKMLWEEGVECFDGSREETFTLRALLLWTINDFPAYGNLSGYSVKGYFACPICGENTCSKRLEHERKICYMGHRRFLPQAHRFRKQKKAFNGEAEHVRAPKPLSGAEVLDSLSGVEVVLGKGRRPSNTEGVWKKRSIFFDLPYWKDLLVRHNLDVMHIEKNVCESLIGTLLNIPGKTKDGENARLDMVAMGIRESLKPVSEEGKRTFLPAACYTLSRSEKKQFCSTLAGVKVPTGYSSNIKSLVQMKDLKLINLKSHDCHTLMQQLLPIAIRGVLPKEVRNTIIRLCYFFNSICSKIIDPSKLQQLQDEVVVTLCLLEKYFPPAFFDVMVHLTVHLPREIKLCGSVWLRWMYSMERYMKILKGYVRNRHRPEGCIIECYIAEEAVEFCSEYLANARTIGVPKGIEERIESRSGFKVIPIDYKTLCEAHYYVLQNTTVVDPYMCEHLSFVRTLHPMKAKNEKWLQAEHKRSFSSWFKRKIETELVRPKNTISQQIRWLAHEPKREVLSYSGYGIGGYYYNTSDHDSRSTTQNSGVMVEAESLHMSTAKDKNPIYANMLYYGVIEDIWELNYTQFKIPVFRCKWVDNKGGVKVDENGFTLVDLNKEGDPNDQFIFASQAKQVFYVNDPNGGRWSVVLTTKPKLYDRGDVCDNIEETPSFSRGLPESDDIDNEDVAYVREDCEGIYVEEDTTSRKKRKKT